MANDLNSRLTDEQRQAQQLRRAALAERPEYSEKLHARIMGAVDPWDNPVAIYREPARTGWARFTASAWVPLTVAASLLIAVGLYVRQISLPQPVVERIVVQDVSRWLAPLQVPESQLEQAIVRVDQPTTQNLPNSMALAVADPLKGITLRTSQLPIAAAARLGQFRQANSDLATSMVMDQLASLDYEARSAANRFFGIQPTAGVEGLLTPEGAVDPAITP